METWGRSSELGAYLPGWGWCLEGGRGKEVGSVRLILSVSRLALATEAGKTDDRPCRQQHLCTKVGTRKCNHRPCVPLCHWEGGKNSDVKCMGNGGTFPTPWNLPPSRPMLTWMHFRLEASGEG